MKRFDLCSASVSLSFLPLLSSPSLLQCFHHLHMIKIHFRNPALPLTSRTSLSDFGRSQFVTLKYCLRPTKVECVFCHTSLHSLDRPSVAVRLPLDQRWCSLALTGLCGCPHRELFRITRRAALINHSPTHEKAVRFHSSFRWVDVEGSRCVNTRQGRWWLDYSDGPRAVLFQSWRSRWTRSLPPEWRPSPRSCSTFRSTKWSWELGKRVVMICGAESLELSKLIPAVHHNNHKLESTYNHGIISRRKSVKACRQLVWGSPFPQNIQIFTGYAFSRLLIYSRVQFECLCHFERIPCLSKTVAMHCISIFKNAFAFVFL